jgi:hypothetical protein
MRPRSSSSPNGEASGRCIGPLSTLDRPFGLRLADSSDGVILFFVYRFPD